MIKKPICMIIAIFLVLTVTAPDAFADTEPGDESTNSESTELSQELDAKPAFDAGTVALQGLAGAAPIGIATLLLSQYGMAEGGVGILGPLMVLSLPLTVPTLVNTVGNARGYKSQHFGGYVGAAAGFFASTLTFEILEETGVTNPTATAGPILVSTAVGAGAILTGSLVGYHIQAHIRHQRAEELQATATVVPIMATTSNSKQMSPGLGIGGYF